MQIELGPVTITPEIEEGCLRSLGAIDVGGISLRDPRTRFLPWFDSYENGPYTRFDRVRIDHRGDHTIMTMCALSDPDYPFMERRDSSGDICLQGRSWDAPPAVAELRIVFAPAANTIDGRNFTGFRYWFEIDANEPIHRILDRQTWEVGGDLEQVTVHCRNLFDLPRQRLGRDVGYSTVGLENWAKLVPGNLWARWSLLPSFDLQHGSAGILLGCFDEVSCIRTVVETTPGENCLRIVDAHYVAAGRQVRTNPKTILHCPDVLDDLDALNLWTRIHDREAARAAACLEFPADGPPGIVFSQNHWRDFDFARSYDHVVEVAAEFGADYVFIDPVWQHGEALRRAVGEPKPGTATEKLYLDNMCCTLDFEVAREMGGEEGLRQLVAEAAARGVRILSWMSLHYHPATALAHDPELGHGSFGIFAAKESGRHPDTGYAGQCWTVNMNAPVRDKIREQLLGVCERTGLAGFLWDSFSNLGWWQVDYSDSSMRPQFDHVARLWSALAEAGLYLMPEALVGWSTRSCLGLHGGDVYADDLLPYSYATNIGYGRDGLPDQVLRGEQPVDALFRAFANLRVPTMALHQVPREQWDSAAAASMRELFAAYRAVREEMRQRTVLPNDRGVCYGDHVLWSYAEQPWDAPLTDVLTGAVTRTAAPYRVYRVGSNQCHSTG